MKDEDINKCFNKLILKVYNYYGSNKSIYLQIQDKMNKEDRSIQHKILVLLKNIDKDTSLNLLRKTGFDEKFIVELKI